MQQNYINHIALVLDASASMFAHRDAVVMVADEQIKHLARRSQELDQETRVTVYTFSDRVECLIYDRDVLRLPSIRDLYRPGGNTALIDATRQALLDLSETPEKYGDHAFLVYVLTDGEENVSKTRPAQLAQQLRGLRDHWTVAALVPNAAGKHEAKKFGFPADNIAVWDTQSSDGVVEVGGRIKAATEAYMVLRSSGTRGTTSLFSMSPDVVNKATVVAAGLTPMDPDHFMVIPVPRTVPLREFVIECGYLFRVGRAFYQLMKPEKIQADKEIAIMEVATRRVYRGAAARQLIGLPDVEVKVKPEHNPDYRIFVQSKSVNRNLMPGTQLLYMLV